MYKRSGRFWEFVCTKSELDPHLLLSARNVLCIIVVYEVLGVRNDVTLWLLITNCQPTRASLQQGSLSLESPDSTEEMASVLQQ